MRWRKYIVGLVDLLGQSRKLDELNSLWWEIQDPRGVEEKEKPNRIRELTNDTYGEVKYFRKLFTDSFNIFKKYVLENTRNKNLSPDEQALVTRMTEDMCTLRSFSDMVMFYTPLDSTEGLLSRFRLAAMLYACVGILTVEFKAGTFFRGGIEVGIGTEFDNGDIYGPVLNDVHQLEKEIADYPRIVIGMRLSEFIRSEGQATDMGEFLNSVLAKVNDFCKKIVCRDNDGLVIVDYLGEEAVDMNRSQYSEACDFAKRGMAKVEGELNAHKKEGNQDLVKRYEKLLAYYQSRMKFWDN